MKIWRVVLLVACGLAAGAVLGACGASGEAAEPTSWARRADRRCSEAIYRFIQMPPIHFATYRHVVPRIAENEHDLVRWLRNLEAPEEGRRSIGRLIGLLDLQARTVDKAIDDYTGDIDFAAHKQDVREARRLSGQIAAAARDTGATACAQPPVTPRYL
jgi:hypothetical protein